MSSRYFCCTSTTSGDHGEATEDTRSSSHGASVGDGAAGVAKTQETGKKKRDPAILMYEYSPVNMQRYRQGSNLL